MNLGLGIDTGGTFTDAAILDLDTKKVLVKAKSPTTYHDLAIGITGAIDNALAQQAVDVRDIKMVGLSTTLATNSILEGRGGDVGLIGIGWTPDKEWKFPSKESRFIKGGYDSMGGMIEPLDEAEAERVIDEICPHVDAVVISGKFSVSNPIQESTVSGMVSRKYGIPVVQASHMTAELGIYERTVTAVLNARLLPVIREFLLSVEKALTERSIDAAVYVFKGDGGLMSLDVAKKMPVETILSGPAASLMGGMALAGTDSCVVVDVGGTSTDIAYVDDGFPRLNQEGAMVGNWRTRVQAIDIWTAALGGDSVLRNDDKGDLTLGPDRVLPVSVAAKRHPALKERIAALGTVTFYVTSRPPAANFSAKDRSVYNFVKEHAPCSMHDALTGIDDVVFVKDQLMSLKARGYILEVGLSPTDAMAVRGQYGDADREAALLGFKIFGDRIAEEPVSLANKVFELAVTRIGEELIKKGVSDTGAELGDETSFASLARGNAGAGNLKDFDIKARPRHPIVGVGAPAQVLVKPLEGRMDAEVLITDHYDVGNAVGAVLSQISESILVQVYPKDLKYVVFCPGSSPVQYSTIDSARGAAVSYAEYNVKEKMKKHDAVDVKVRTQVEESKFCDGYGQEMKFINWINVRAIATGKPRLRD